MADYYYVQRHGAPRPPWLTGAVHLQCPCGYTGVKGFTRDLTMCCRCDRNRRKREWRRTTAKGQAEVARQVAKLRTRQPARRQAR